jgi:CheY-like chemotaxis protein
MRAPTILVVDDDPDMRLYLRGCLRGLGGGEGLVLEAGDGDEALRVMREAQVDLVISDVVLPHLDGRALLKAIRAGPARTQPPVLLVSGQEHPASPDGPMDAWLSKPFNARQLLAAVERLLEGRPPLPRDSHPTP